MLKQTCTIRILCLLLLSHNVRAQHLSLNGYTNDEQNDADSEANDNYEESLIASDNARQTVTKVYIAGPEDRLYNMIDDIENKKSSNEILIHFYLYKEGKFSYVRSLRTSFDVLKSVLFLHTHYFYKTKSVNPESIEYYANNLIILSEEIASADNSLSVDESQNHVLSKEDVPAIATTRDNKGERGNKHFYEFNITSDKNYKGKNINVYIDKNRDFQNKKVNNKEIRLNNDLNGKYYEGEDINVGIYHILPNDEYEVQSGTHSIHYDRQGKDINYKEKDIDVEVLTSQHDDINDICGNRNDIKIQSDVSDIINDISCNGNDDVSQPRYINSNDLGNTGQNISPSETYNKCIDENQENSELNTPYNTNYKGKDINIFQAQQVQDLNNRPSDVPAYYRDNLEINKSGTQRDTNRDRNLDNLDPQESYDNFFSKTPSDIWTDNNNVQHKQNENIVYELDYPNKHKSKDVDVELLNLASNNDKNNYEFVDNFKQMNPVTYQKGNSDYLSKHAPVENENFEKCFESVSEEQTDAEKINDMLNHSFKVSDESNFKNVPFQTLNNEERSELLTESSTGSKEMIIENNRLNKGKPCDSTEPFENDYSGPLCYQPGHVGTAHNKIPCYTASEILDMGTEDIDRSNNDRKSQPHLDDLYEIGDSNIDHPPNISQRKDSNSGPILNTAQCIESLTPQYRPRKLMYNPIDVKTQPWLKFPNFYEPSQINHNIPQCSVFSPQPPFIYNDKSLNEHFPQHIYYKPRVPSAICKTHRNLKLNVPKRIAQTVASHSESSSAAKGYCAGDKPSALDRLSEDFKRNNYASTIPKFKYQTAKMQSVDSIRYSQPTCSDYNTFQTIITPFSQIYSTPSGSIISQKNQAVPSISASKTLQNQHPDWNLENTPQSSQIACFSPNCGNYGTYKPPPPLYCHSISPNPKENVRYVQNPFNGGITPCISSINTPFPYKSDGTRVNQVYLKPKDPSSNVFWRKYKPLVECYRKSPKRIVCGVETLHTDPKTTWPIVSNGKFCSEVAHNSYLPQVSRHNHPQTSGIGDSKSIQYKPLNSQWTTLQNSYIPQNMQKFISHKDVPRNERPNTFQYGSCPGIQEMITEFRDEQCSSQYKKAFGAYRKAIPYLEPQRPQSHFTYPCNFQRPFTDKYSNNAQKHLNEPRSRNQLFTLNAEIPGCFPGYSGMFHSPKFPNNKDTVIPYSNTQFPSQNICPHPDKSSIFTCPKYLYTHNSQYKDTPNPVHYKAIDNFTPISYDSFNIRGRPNPNAKHYSNNIFATPCKSYITPHVFTEPDKTEQNPIGIKPFAASTNPKICSGRENLINNSPFVKNMQCVNAYTPSFRTTGSTNYNPNSFNYETVRIPGTYQYPSIYTHLPRTNTQNPFKLYSSSPRVKEKHYNTNNLLETQTTPNTITAQSTSTLQASVDRRSVFERENSALYTDCPWLETPVPFAAIPWYYTKLNTNSQLKLHPNLKSTTQTPLEIVSATNGPYTFGTSPRQHSQLNYPAVKMQKLSPTMNSLSYQSNKVRLTPPTSHNNPCTQLYNRYNVNYPYKPQRDSVPYVDPHAPPSNRFPFQNSIYTSPFRPLIQSQLPSCESNELGYEFPYKHKAPSGTSYPSGGPINYSANTLTTSAVPINDPSGLDSELPRQPKVFYNRVLDQYRRPNYWSSLEDRSFPALSEYNDPKIETNSKKYFNANWPSPFASQPLDPKHVQHKSTSFITATNPIGTSLTGLNQFNPFNVPNQQINSPRVFPLNQHPAMKSHWPKSETLNIPPCDMTPVTPMNEHPSQSPEMRITYSPPYYKNPISREQTFTKNTHYNKLDQHSYDARCLQSNQMPPNRYKLETFHRDRNGAQPASNLETPKLPVNTIKDIYANRLNERMPNVLPLQYFEDNFHNPDPNSFDTLSMDLGSVAVAKYKEGTRYVIHTNNPHVDLLLWSSKIKRLTANLVIQVNDRAAVNVVPVIRGPVSEGAANALARGVVARMYGEPLLVKGLYSVNNPYAVVINDAGSNNVLWPARSMVA